MIVQKGNNRNQIDIIVSQYNLKTERVFSINLVVNIKQAMRTLATYKCCLHLKSLVFVSLSLIGNDALIHAACHVVSPLRFF